MEDARKEKGATELNGRRRVLVLFRLVQISISGKKMKRSASQRSSEGRSGPEMSMYISKVLSRPVPVCHN